MARPAKFASRDDAKKAGWFSRRHQTPEAHRAEQERYRERMKNKGKSKTVSS